MNKLLIVLSLLFIGIGLIISVYFFYSLSDQYSVTGLGDLKMAETGQVGDFIGGIVGTLFALSGTFLIYLSFREQTNQNKREAFESAFFEMLRLHKENVSELKYSKTTRNGLEDAENRKVFRLIYSEFFECFREVNKFYRYTSGYILPSYEKRLKVIINRINPKISLKEMVMIDIAYSVVFFGVGDDGLQTLRNRFKNKYDQVQILQLLHYLRLKPKLITDFHYLNWQYLKGLKARELRATIFELYDYKRNAASSPVILSNKELEILSNNDFIKYYGGHQFRLGHYYRHLFQTYKYLHYHKNISESEKYFYAKTLRAQLSTHEQALLFINSISTLGMKWEYTPEYDESLNLKGEELEQELKKNHLISNYKLIKNLPGRKSFGIEYKTYYPEIKFEWEE